MVGTRREQNNNARVRRSTVFLLDYYSCVFHVFWFFLVYFLTFLIRKR